MITLTEAAAKEIKDIFIQENFDPLKTYLRVAVKGGGCSGFTYVLDIQDSKKETDEEFLTNDVRVICDAKSLLYLTGTTIDYKDELMGRGFVFKNPNSTSVCGCGSSFSA